MASIQPTTATTPTVAATAAAGTVTPVDATVTSVPDKIQQLLRQLQVSGTLAAAPDDSSVTINTVIGQLTIVLPQLSQEEKQKLIQTLLSLFESQKPLTVVVQPGDPPTHAILLLPSSPGTVTAQSVTNAPNLGPLPVQLPPQPLTIGLQLTATVLPPETAAALPSSSGPPPSTLPAPPPFPATILENEASIAAGGTNPGAGGTQPVPQGTVPLALPMVTSVPEEIIPGAPIGVAPSAPQAAASVPVPPGAIPPQSTSTVPIATLLQPGKDVVITVNAVTPPNTTPPVPATPNQIVATVIGNGPNGQLVLKAADTVLYIKQNFTAPVGTNVLLTVDALKPALLPQTDVQNFPALQQALAALAQADPQAVLQFLQNVVPQPNERLSGMLLLFLSAFKQGDSRSWPGSIGSDILNRMGKMELLAKLSGDISHAGLPAHDATVGEWKSYPIPLHADGRFQVLDFYVHNDKQGQSGNNEQRNNPGRVRFLIDMRMSRLGAIQLDGLVQPKKLDMIIRSERALPAQLPNDLRDSYVKTLGALGYTGGLSFQIGWQHWLAIKKDSKTSVTT